MLKYGKIASGMPHNFSQSCGDLLFSALLGRVSININNIVLKSEDSSLKEHKKINWKVLVSTQPAVLRVLGSQCVISVTVLTATSPVRIVTGRNMGKYAQPFKPLSTESLGLGLVLVSRTVAASRRV